MQHLLFNSSSGLQNQCTGPAEHHHTGTPECQPGCVLLQAMWVWRNVQLLRYCTPATQTHSLLVANLAFVALSNNDGSLADVLMVAVWCSIARHTRSESDLRLGVLSEPHGFFTLQLLQLLQLQSLPKEQDHHFGLTMMAAWWSFASRPGHCTNPCGCGHKALHLCPRSWQDAKAPGCHDTRALAWPSSSKPTLT